MPKLSEEVCRRICERLGADPMTFIRADVRVWLPNSAEQFIENGQVHALVPLWQIIQRAAGEVKADG